MTELKRGTAGIAGEAPGSPIAGVLGGSFIMLGLRSDPGWTNQVLREHQRDRELYYLPAYLRIKLKNYIQLLPSTREAEINADLLFTVHFAGVPAFVADELESGITLQFNRSETVTLARSIEVSCVRKEGTLSFTLRKRLKCAIDSNFFWAPFELIYLALVVTVRSLSLADPQTGTPVTLRFNLMDHPLRYLKVSLTRERSFGHYCLAPRRIRVFYSRELYHDPTTSNQEQEQEEEGNHLISLENELQESAEMIREQEEEPLKVGYYQYAHFVVPMFRRPFVALSTIYLPLWSLSLYNLFMYYQSSSNLSMRVANGMVIIVTIFAYVPTLRDQLPTTPNLLLAEIIIYLICATFILNLIQGTIAYYEPPDYAIQWNTDPFFIATLTVNVLSVAVVLLLSLLHKFKWEKQYLEEEMEAEPKFVRQEWSNEECDQYFRQFPQVKPLK